MNIFFQTYQLFSFCFAFLSRQESHKRVSALYSVTGVGSRRYPARTETVVPGERPPETKGDIWYIRNRITVKILKRISPDHRLAVLYNRIIFVFKCTFPYSAFKADGDRLYESWMALNTVVCRCLVYTVVWYNFD